MAMAVQMVGQHEVGNLGGTISHNAQEVFRDDEKAASLLNKAVAASAKYNNNVDQAVIGLPLLSY
jgi:hypothetical protein